MDDAQFLVQIDNGINKLFEDDCRLVLLKETVSFGILIEIPLHDDLSDDIDVSPSFELP